MKRRILIYDTTLRDGSQAEDISYSVEDKWKIARALDELGVAYLEAGNPGSNRKDLEFFRSAAQQAWKNAKLTAFGSTRHKNQKVEDDDSIRALLSAETLVVAIFGKSWDFHVKEIIDVGLDQNLRMIEETVAFFKNKGKEVIYDAEHFFDGYKSDPKYAFKTLEAALCAGADWLVLCETNGGAFPDEVYDISKTVVKKFPLPLGIHCHDDGGMAVANSTMAVQAGLGQVQGTFLGLGERCGNANLSAIIANLQMKRGYACIPDDQMPNLTQTARFIAEVSNIPLNKRLPYVGKSAFAHKGGMHIDGVLKKEASFEHINPAKVGNERRFLISEVAGRSTLLKKINDFIPGLRKQSHETKVLLDKLKVLEHEGYQFEAAECSLELIARRLLGKYSTFFRLENYIIIGELPHRDGEVSSSAIIKVNVDGRQEVAAAEGNGPVNALDNALRRALEIFYPGLKEMHLNDYKVRVLNPSEATAAKVRVLIESTDGKDIWTTVGVSTDIIEASCIALVDSIEYKLMRDAGEKTAGLFER